MNTIAVVFLLLQGAGPSKPIDVPLPAPTRSVEVLEQALFAADATTRAAAAWEIAAVPSVDEATIALLKELLNDSAKAVRYGAAWALGHLAHDSGDYDEPPDTIRTVPPKYPAYAYMAGVEGTVTLEVLIGEEGEVAHSRVMQSIPALDDAATKCVHQWRFKPAQRLGKPAAMVATTPIRFVIK
jgi:protein TonB